MISWAVQTKLNLVVLSNNTKENLQHHWIVNDSLKTQPNKSRQKDEKNKQKPAFLHKLIPFVLCVSCNKKMTSESNRAENVDKDRYLVCLLNVCLAGDIVPELYCCVVMHSA